jgi:hypothetical protein
MSGLAFHFAKALVHGTKAGDVIYYYKATPLPHEDVLRELPGVLQPLGLKPEAFDEGVRAVVL